MDGWLIDNDSRDDVRNRYVKRKEGNKMEKEGRRKRVGFIDRWLDIYIYIYIYTLYTPRI